MTQIREEAYFTIVHVIVRGKTVKRSEAKKEDYLFFYKPNIPLTVIEAKDNNHSVGDGTQQALDYAEIIDLPFAYSSNNRLVEIREAAVRAVFAKTMSRRRASIMNEVNK